MNPPPLGRQSRRQRQAVSDFEAAILQALESQPRCVHPKFLYDEAGSQWFARICDLPEYYVTRVEMDILRAHGQEIAQCVGPAADLIEFGAGSSRKVRSLLQDLSAPVRYCPVDISGVHLRASARQLQQDMPWLHVKPVEADILAPITLPPLPRSRLPVRAEGQSGSKVRRVGLFLGSSLGNFDASEARSFLMLARSLLKGGGLLIGVDLVKDPAVLHAAYNDTAGVTAAFNLNLLERANRELGTNFDVSAFFHHACYRPPERCVEMHLVNQIRQEVVLGERSFVLAEGEAIHTETSRKYTLDALQSLARSCGWTPGPAWSDVQGWYALQWLDATTPGPVS